MFIFVVYTLGIPVFISGDVNMADKLSMAYGKPFYAGVS